MKPNPNPNFLDSATNYWASKLKFMQKAPATPEMSTPPIPQTNPPFISTANSGFYSPIVYSPNPMMPQVIAPMPQPQQPFYIQNQQNYVPMGRFQNLAPQPMYPNNVKLVPSRTDAMGNFYPPSQNFYYQNQNQNENLFGAVLKKANNFWQCSPQSTQSHAIQRPQFFYPPQGYHSDPISRDFTNSNRESELFSWETSFSKGNFGEEKKPEVQVQKKIKKKNYHKKKGKGKGVAAIKRPNDSVSIAKKLLAIANNWQEVCKKIPENMQNTFKEKMKRYLKRKILPDLELKNKLQRFINKEPSLETEPNQQNEENNMEENKEKNEMAKFDEIFGKDLDKILERHQEDGTNNTEPKGGLNGMGWPPRGAFNNQFELESPTLSKILKQDGLSINYEFKEKEFANEYEMKSVFFEKNENRQDDELLVDSMINENKDEKKGMESQEMG